MCMVPGTVVNVSQNALLRGMQFAFCMLSTTIVRVALACEREMPTAAAGRTSHWPWRGPLGVPPRSPPSPTPGPPRSPWADASVPQSNGRHIAAISTLITLCNARTPNAPSHVRSQCKQTCSSCKPLTLVRCGKALAHTRAHDDRASLQAFLCAPQCATWQSREQ
jgi:hypothetical protein